MPVPSTRSNELHLDSGGPAEAPERYHPDEVTKDRAPIYPPMSEEPPILEHKNCSIQSVKMTAVVVEQVAIHNGQVAVDLVEEPL
nr:hypothetical protein [Nitrosomonas nitrosa]